MIYCSKCRRDVDCRKISARLFELQFAEKTRPETNIDIKTQLSAKVSSGVEMTANDLSQRVFELSQRLEGLQTRCVSDPANAQWIDFQIYNPG